MMPAFLGNPIAWEEFKKLLEDNHVPPDVKIYSDSGWECGPTGVFGGYYNPFLRVIVLTQCDEPDYEGKEWVQLF